MPERRRTRAEERVEEIDVSPTALLANIETLTAERDARDQGVRGLPGRAPARARRVPELQAADRRGTRPRPRAGRRGPHPQGPEPRRRLRPRHRGPARRRSPTTPGSRASPPSTASCASLLESEGVTPDRRHAGHAVRSARARSHRHGPRHRTGPKARSSRQPGAAIDCATASCARPSWPSPQHPTTNDIDPTAPTH